MTVAVALAAPSYDELANLLNAVSAFVKVLVWPVFCAYVVSVFKPEIARVCDALIQKIPDLSTGKFAGVSLQFQVKEKRTQPKTGIEMLDPKRRKGTGETSAE